MTAALPKSTTIANAETTDVPTETRILLEGVSWETYERLLEDTGSGRSQRFAYTNGILEIMLPLRGHEEPTRLFDDFVAVFVDALGLELCKLGSLTMKQPTQKKGLEPDGCFYIQNEAAIRGVDQLDFAVHPPPDLVVEVDNSSGSLDKFPIYVALKVPEIWRLRRGVLTIYLLNGEQTQYAEVEQSLAFPQLPVQELPVFFQRARVVGQRFLRKLAKQSAVRELAERARQMLEQPI